VDGSFERNILKEPTSKLNFLVLGKLMMKGVVTKRYTLTL
jgi:hypothetical protein